MRIPYEADDYPSRRFQTSGTDLAWGVGELATLVVLGDSLSPALYREMLFTVTRIAQADHNHWDVKIMLQTLHETEHVFSVLKQFKRRRKVAVLGSAHIPVEHPVYALACKLGEELARYGPMVITGASGDITAIAHGGAGLKDNLDFNIALPFEQHTNHTIDGSDNLLSFRFFFLRELLFVREADALVLCPGNFGTLDEALEMLTLVQTGRGPPVSIVLFSQPGGRYWEHVLEFIQGQLLKNHYILLTDMRLMRLVYSAESAVKEIAQFYHNSHSGRQLKGTFVIRLNHALNEAALAHPHEHLTNLCLSDGFQQQAYSGQEQDESEFCNLICLAFMFNGRDQGRLWELLDYTNLPENWDRSCRSDTRPIVATIAQQAVD